MRKLLQPKSNQFKIKFSFPQPEEKEQQKKYIPITFNFTITKYNFLTWLPSLLKVTSLLYAFWPFFSSILLLSFIVVVPSFVVPLRKWNTQEERRALVIPTANIRLFDKITQIYHCVYTHSVLYDIYLFCATKEFCHVAISIVLPHTLQRQRSIDIQTDRERAVYLSQLRSLCTDTSDAESGRSRVNLLVSLLFRYFF